NIFNFMGASETEASTVLFTLFVVFQLFNAFNSRELTSTSIFKNLGNNKLMLGVFSLTFCLQLIITQFGGALFNTVALPLVMWIKIVAVAASIILVSEIIKLIIRKTSK
ncbi:MAG: cation transporting ATPase C-terminal domain-containing protein, partial [Clostridium sp.]